MKIIINAFLIILIGTCLVVAQEPYFGKNKVQHADFKWHYLQSEHLDIYFSTGGSGVATFVAQVGEESYQKLRASFRYDLTERIKIIVYNSHNDFGQTNVDLNPPEESVGGFTEFFKNRVVIPYEGEWEKFRHVIHHELTHAVMLQMVYGGGVQSIITGLTQLQLPLWFIEGLAEYESRSGWDIESDMFMRDATVNGYLPEIPYLGGFLAYKGGQSVWNYISDRYGVEKVGELLGKVKINKSLERGLKQSIGMDEKELNKRWQLYLKRKYWPDITDRKQPEEIAKKLTDHLKDRSFVNTSPSISNKGDKIAYLSDKEDYFDIYIASTIDGKVLKKLVRGQRAGNLEELHWLRGPGISWSPDDRKIVFSAKAGDEDALHIVDVRKSRIEQSIETGLDAIYNSTWSPNGDEIAFMGTKNGQGDLYAYHLKNKKLRKITDDLFSDVEPRWSPDGTKILFASDRGSAVDSVDPNLNPFNIDMKNYDIYEVNADGTGMRRLVESPFEERTPIYSPDGKLAAFTSDRSGVSNIYLKNLETGEEWPITNVLTGAFLPSWGGNTNRLAFASFFYAGYDIYLMKNPLDIKPGDLVIPETQYLKSIRGDTLLIALARMGSDSTQVVPTENGNAQQKYREFIFDEKFAQGEIQDQEKPVALDSVSYALPTGEFKIHDYKVKFSPDLVYGSVGYSQFFGTQGFTNILLSDVLGNHRIAIAANLFGDFRNADYAVTYFYLPKRLDIGTGIYHNAYYFWSPSIGWVRDRNFGANLLLSNPFDKFTRLDFGLSLNGISRSYLDLPDDLVDLLSDAGYISATDRFFLLNNLSYTKDTTVWGYTGPTNGSRYSVGVTYSPKLGKSGIDFTTVRGDYRKYLRVSRDFSFALRGAGGMSFGVHPQKFFLGGTPNWINYKFNGGIRVENVEEIYFAAFEMPLRGANYYGLEGNRFLLTNLEFRFPLIRQLLMGFPLPLFFTNIGGSLFTDIGFAWDKDENQEFWNHVKAFDRKNLFDNKFVFASYGFGTRINLGFFLIRLDFAWPTDFKRSAGSPTVLWSMGADF